MKVNALSVSYSIQTKRNAIENYNNNKQKGMSVVNQKLQMPTLEQMQKYSGVSFNGIKKKLLSF